jgi:hypothetical protein
MLPLFQMFEMNVANISCVDVAKRITMLRCSIRFTRMLQLCYFDVAFLSRDLNVIIMVKQML